ncbi:MAG TPA: winged helix DNA-binding domain-containing protein [Ilumatobacter sp.]|nr:winged helix DNA-binding domain-containing protein [Ilumatobacter sp.]
MKSTLLVVSAAERRRRIGIRHLLLPGTRVDDVADIADAVVALHSSDPVTVPLSIAARHQEPTIELIDRALHESGTLVRHHGMRRTLWVMTPEVAGVAHAASTRKLSEAERRKSIAFLDGDAAWLDAATDAVCALLATTDPLSTRDICLRLPEFDRQIVRPAPAGRVATQSGLSRVVLQAGFDGRLVRGRPLGSWVSSQHTWTVPEQSVHFERDIDVATGAAAMTRGLLMQFGPMTETDIAWWGGWTKAQTRAALAAVAAEEVDLPDSGTGHTGWVLPGDGEPTDECEPWVAVLPGLDPTAMGWKQREWYLDASTAKRVMDTNGNIGPTLWADGRIVGGWVQRPDGSFATEFTTPVGQEHRRLLAAEIERIRAFVGETRFKVRFPSANQRDLLS